MANNAAPVNFPNAGHFYSNIVKPVEVKLQFTVTPSASSGTTSVMSNGYVLNVFMNTTGTASTSGSPGPAAGIGIIKLAGNFRKCLGMDYSFHNNAVGSSVTSTTTGVTYVIRTLGTTTAAQWLAAGLPAGFTAAIGQAFTAIATGAIGGTGSVQVTSVSGITSIEFVGGPSALIANSNTSANGGAQVFFQTLGATSGGNTALIPTAPAAGTIIRMTLYFDNSSVSVDGL